MFKVFSFLFFIIPAVSILQNNNELRRQYNDYRKIFNKNEVENGFENFVQNLNKIEVHNNEHSGCKLYLNRYSDQEGDNSVHNICKEDSERLNIDFIWDPIQKGYKLVKNKDIIKIDSDDQ